MSPRSIRRAAERRAEKEASKALRHAPAEFASPLNQPAALTSDVLDWEPDTYHPAPLSISAAHHSANLQNAQLSTGPRTLEGKRIASMNAVKTGLTGRTVLLPTDDAGAYRQHLAAYTEEHRPATPRESELVQSLADTQWRLTRIPALESAIYARGRHESAEMYSNLPQAERISLIDLEVHLRYEKQLRNLQLQESRLYRRYTLDLAELRRLQAERKAATEATAQATAKSAAKTASAPSVPTPTEFVFSTAASAPEHTATPRAAEPVHRPQETKKAA